VAGLVDTHCHIDLDSFADDRDGVINRARAAGVDQMILVAFNAERWRTGAALCARTEGIHLAVGLHPTEAEAYNDTLEQALQQTVKQTKAVAIGETGFDYHWKTETARTQREAFVRQIELARELNLRFIIHHREAEADTLDVLRATEPPHRGVMHCFTGNAEYADRCLELGLYIGLGGAVTFRKAKALHEAVRQIPLDRIVLETDAPFMTPSPHRGQRNEPAYVRYILEHVATLRDCDADELATITTRNATELFALPAYEPASSSRNGQT
jgi:TatD DNase family protein